MADESALTADAVARRLGLSPSTLRSWSRRYGLAVGDGESGQLRYTAEDVAGLSRMRSLIAGGMTPGDAAQAVLAVRAEHAEAAGDRPADAPEASPDDPPVARDLDLPGTSELVRELAAAAMTLDARVIVEIVRVAVACDGALGAWEDLLIPLIAGISEQQLATGGLVDVEHVFTAAASHVLAEVAAALPGPARHPPVLLSCAEDEQHTLPLHVLAAALAEEGVATRMLGARVPLRALADAIWRTDPAVVVLWSQTEASGDPAPLAKLEDHPSHPKIFVGGPGWDRHRIPDAVQFLPSVAVAVAEVGAALGLELPA
jgi:MerR family transcriptional regulator, light-induced transcriptional regulator